MLVPIGHSDTNFMTTTGVFVYLRGECDASVRKWQWVGFFAELMGKHLEALA